MLKFIPYDDLNENAADAAGINTIDFGYVQVGETATDSIRLGNDSANSVNYVLSVDSCADWIEIAPDSGSLDANECSDTIVLVVSPPLDASTESHSVDLIVLTGTGEDYRLELFFSVVGANVPRESQYPERRTSFTDNVSDVVGRVGEPLRLYRYDPVAYDPLDTRVILDQSEGRRLNGDAGTHRWMTQGNVAERLNPSNEEWGYTRSDEIIVASFHDESTEIEVSFSRENSMMTYTSTAYLVVPAEYEFEQVWALFAPERDPDPAQYKRTVYLIQRQGDFWCLHSIYSRYRGNELSHYECELVQLHKQAQGSAAYYNPFAWTYEKDVDKPYRMYVTDFDLLPAYIGEDASGSNVACSS